MDRFLERGCLLFAWVGMLAMTGCLSGGYDQEFADSLSRYRKDSELQQLRPAPHSLLGDRLTLRVPKLFQSEDATGANPRSKPPFLQDFPGFQIAFESMVEAEGTQFPVVLTVGGLADNGSSLEDLKKSILQQVQQTDAFAKTAWATVEPQPDAGGGVPWAVLKLRGQQPFDRVVSGNPETKNTDGETQVWVASDPASKVAAVLAWRVPEEVATTVALDDLAALVTRTVAFRPAQDPAAAPGPADPAAAAAPADPAAGQ